MTPPVEDDASTQHAEATRVRRNWDVPAFITGQSLSVLGDQAYFVALSWAALTVSGSSTAQGLVLMTAALPRAVLMLAGGVLVDRLGPRTVLLATDALRAVVLLLAFVVVLAADLHLWLLVALALVFGIVDAFFYPATSSMLPALTSGKPLVRANGIRATSQQSAVLLGSPLGGLLLTISGFTAALLANVVTFGVSFAALLSIRGGRRPAVVAQDAPNSFWRELVDGLSYVARNPVLRTITVALTLVGFGFAGAIDVGLPLLVRNRGWGANGFGVLLGAMGAGTLCGAALISAVRRRVLWSPVTAMLASAAQAGTLIAVISAGSLLQAWLWLAASGLLLSIATTPLLTLAQTAGDASLLGRAMAVITFGTVGLTPLAFPLSGLLGSSAGPEAVVAVFGGIVALAAVVGLSNRALRTARVPLGDPAGR